MANLAARAGGVPIRIGGNTQEFAVMVDNLPNGRTFGKEDSGSTQTVRVISYSPSPPPLIQQQPSDENSRRCLYAGYVLHVLKYFFICQRKMVFWDPIQRFGQFPTHHRRRIPEHSGKQAPRPSGWKRA